MEKGQRALLQLPGCIDRSRRSRLGAGYTLLELLLVVSLAGTAISLATPSVSGFVSHQRLVGCSEAVRGLLIAARTRALANPTVPCGVCFMVDSVPARAVSFFDQNRNGTFDAGSERTYMAAVHTPVGITMEVSDSNTSRCVVFRGDGAAKSSGSVLLRAATSARGIHVLRSTGRVRLETR
jgi:Tfp pilus assembly protein FimT